MIFRGMFQSRDIQKVRQIEHPPLSHSAHGVSRARWCESSVIDPISDGNKPAAVDSKEAPHIGCRGITHRDDRVLSMREGTRNRTDVEHALPVVSSSEAKRCEIVDRADLGARRMTYETPMARDVDQIESVPAGQSGKAALMPPDILYRSAIFFLHANDSHRTGCEIEQLCIIFQNEKGKLMPRGMRHERADEIQNILSDSGMAALND